jgi:hypothetical protein
MAINPLQAPINYAAMIPQLNLGQQFAEFGQILAERQKRTQAEEVKQQFATDLQAAQAAGDQKSWLNMIGKYPQFREAFGDVRKGVGEERLKNEFTQGFEISNALENGAIDVAKERVQTIIQAKKNSNEPTKIYEDVFNALESGNIKGAQAGVNLALTALDPDRFTKSVTAKTTAEKAPSEVLKVTSEAIIKEQEAKFAPEKFLTDLNLTKEQIEQAKAARRASNAAAEKSGAEAKRASAEADQILTGIIPADKRPEAEAKFRKEYSDQTKGYQEVKSAYGRILAVSDPKSPDEEAAADLALVFNFMKMQDPGSTVNTGEFSNAQNAAGVPDRLRNIYNNLLTGGRLNPTQRKAFAGQAKNLYKVAGQQEDIVRQGVGRIAKGYGLNTENIFYTPTEISPTPLSAPPSGNSVKVGGQTYNRPANFTDAQWNAYKQSVGAQ